MRNTKEHPPKLAMPKLTKVPEARRLQYATTTPKPIIDLSLPSIDVGWTDANVEYGLTDWVYVADGETVRIDRKVREWIGKSPSYFFESDRRNIGFFAALPDYVRNLANAGRRIPAARHP